MYTPSKEKKSPMKQREKFKGVNIQNLASIRRKLMKDLKKEQALDLSNLKI
jgi:hypothetical protein